MLAARNYIAGKQTVTSHYKTSRIVCLVTTKQVIFDIIMIHFNSNFATHNLPQVPKSEAGRENCVYVPLAVLPFPGRVLLAGSQI